MTKLLATRLRGLAGILAVAMVAVATPVAAQQAGPTLNLSPTSGPSGTTVDADGCGYSVEAQQVTLYWDAVGGEELGTAALSDGCFQTSFNVPSDTAGSHTVFAVDDFENTGEADFELTEAQASLTVEPSRTPPGTDAEASGCDFLADTAVTLAWSDGSTLTTATSDGSGCFDTTFTVPANAVAGDHTVTADDGQESASDSIEVRDPSVHLQPANGAAGAQLTVITCGWPAQSTLDILWNGQEPLGTNVAVDGSGCAEVTDAVPQGAQPGQFPVVATDGALSPQTPFVVEEQLTVAPTLSLLETPAPTVQWQYTDFLPRGVEFTQSIQCFDTSEGLSDCADNSLPLVSGRQTIVRIYLQLSGSTSRDRIDDVPLRFHYRVGGGTWRQLDTAGPALRSIDRTDPDASANIAMVVGTESDLDYFVEVDPDGDTADFVPINNRMPSTGHRTVSFQEREGLEILGQRLDYDPSGYSGPNQPSGWAVDGGGALWLEHTLPVPNAGVEYRNASGFLDWDSTLPGRSNGGNQHDLIEELNGRYVLALIFGAAFGIDLDLDHYYGWWPNAAGGGGHADMPAYPHAGGLGVVGIGEDDPGTSTDDPGAGALIFGHELVHDYDVFHTSTSDDCNRRGDSNSEFPYSSASIQEVGFNPISRTAYDPANTQDVMSYCPAGGSQNGWVSPFTWEKMFDELDPSSSSTSSSGASIAQLGDDTGDELLVRATVNRDGTGELGTAYHTTGATGVPTTPGEDGVIELRDADGEVLASDEFAIDFTSEYPEDEAGDAHGDRYPKVFDEMTVFGKITWDPGAAEIGLIDADGAELDTAEVSESDPSVSFTAPSTSAVWAAGETRTVAWTGSDRDGDALTYTLAYSHDRRHGWDVLADGLTASSFDIEVDALTGGAEGRFRVIASDGVRTATAESAAVSVPRHAPTATIMHPADGLRLREGELLTLSGGAVDAEDGRIPAGDLVWTGDRAGELGTGATVPVDDLEPGEHQLTLTATDSDGQTGTDEARVTVASAGPATVEPSRPVAGEPASASAVLLAGGPAARCTVEYGDGGAPVRGSLEDGRCLGPDHRYQDAGTHRVLVRFLDEEGELIAKTATNTLVAAGELPAVQRLSGANRFATAAAISQARFDRGSPKLYLATGENFADALSGVPAAARASAPILLTSRDTLPQVTAEEIDRLAPDEVVVLGGTAVISEAVVAAVAARTGAPVTRLSGGHRYATSAAISAATFEPGVEVAYVATGQNFADALAGGPAGALTGGPVLLADGEAAPAEIRAELERLRPGRIEVLGGGAAVSDALVQDLATLTDGDVARRSGADRFETATAVSEGLFVRGSQPIILVGTGGGFADALAGGALAGLTPGPFLPVGDVVPQPVQRELERLAPRRIVVLGGTAAVPESVVEELRTFVGE